MSSVTIFENMPRGGGGGGGYSPVRGQHFTLSNDGFRFSKRRGRGCMNLSKYTI